MLLGDVNFMVVPQTNGPSQLFVFSALAKNGRCTPGESRRLPSRALSNSIPRELVGTIKPGS